MPEPRPCIYPYVSPYVDARHCVMLYTIIPP